MVFVIYMIIIWLFWLILFKLCVINFDYLSWYDKSDSYWLWVDNVDVFGKFGNVFVFLGKFFYFGFFIFFFEDDVVGMRFKLIGYVF